MKEIELHNCICGANPVYSLKDKVHLIECTQCKQYSITANANLITKEAAYLMWNQHISKHQKTINKL